MPLPQTRDVGAVMHALNRPGERARPQKQKVAIALNIARKAGADIPPPPGNVRYKRRPLS